MADTFPRQNARTQRFTLGAPRNFTLTTDGRAALFLRSKGPEDPVTCLWAIDVASGAERLLADPADLLADAAGAELPAAERARRERAREGAAGIVGYSADSSGWVLAFALAGRLYVVDSGNSDGSGALLLDTTEGVFDPRMSPDAQHVSYVVGDELHVVSTTDGAPGRVLAAEDGLTVSWGSAEFIAAEEMRRSRGHWWAPGGQRLVVARVDVAPVSEWHIADPAQPWREPVAVRYPAAGTPNATVELALVELSDGARTSVPWDRDLLPYLVDVTWRPEEPLTLVTSTRDQRRMVVFTVDPASGGAEVVAELTDP
ncbi:MAG: DPP IV N-terminal domain-containing protein, partial [Actinomycetota bacterium]|nr:DPP IV N-terminal domain-containing protein [Actinomycetota bacterium]